MELGKVLQSARQNFKDADGKPKPMSQGDLAKMINQKSQVVQECESFPPLSSCLSPPILSRFVYLSTPSFLSFYLSPRHPHLRNES